MANEEHHHGEDDDEQFQAVFGEHTPGISDCLFDTIYEIRRNDLHTTTLVSKDFDDGLGALSDLAWEVLGRYIANSTYLIIVDLDQSGTTDDKATSLFRGLTKSSSIAILDLMRNNIGINAMRSMVPFLKNSPNLSTLRMSSNSVISSEGFEIVMQSLNRSVAMEKLYFTSCNIRDISSLETYPLSNLRELYLSNNNIGRGGFITIANLLQKEWSTLTELYLQSTGMENEEAEIIATSLKHNTKLQRLKLAFNDISQRGYVAFLRLLNDVSSIESTYNSNHTLTTLDLEHTRLENLSSVIHIRAACKLNQESSSSEAAGRAKVIHSQLNSQTRKQYCQWQGIQYSSIGNLLADADIESVLLPDILALIGTKLGQDDLYAALIPLAPELMSYIDRKAMIETMMADRMSKIDARMAQIAALTAEHNELRNRLELIKLGDSKNTSSSSLPMVGKKRERSED